MVMVIIPHRSLCHFFAFCPNIEINLPLGRPFFGILLDLLVDGILSVRVHQRNKSNRYVCVCVVHSFVHSFIRSFIYWASTKPGEEAGRQETQGRANVAVSQTADCKQNSLFLGGMPVFFLLRPILDRIGELN